MARPTSGQAWPRYFAESAAVTLPFPLSPPPTPNANDDEFTSDALDAAWSVQSGFSASGATIDYNFDGTWLWATIPSSATEAARRLLIRKAITGIGTNTAFTLVARICLSCFDSLSTNEIAISFGDNATWNTGNACIAQLQINGANRTLYAKTVGFTEASFNLAGGSSFVYVAFRRNPDGATLDMWYSYDGIDWRVLWGGSSRTYAFSYLFINIVGNNSGTTVNHCGIDFVRINDARFTMPRRT